MTILISDEIWPQIAEQFGLPKENNKSTVIRLEAGEPVQIESVYYLETALSKARYQVIKNYILKER